MSYQWTIQPQGKKMKNLCGCFSHATEKGVNHIKTRIHSYINMRNDTLQYVATPLSMHGAHSNGFKDV